MPVEHELKFVLTDPTNALFDLLSAEYDCHHLEQFYMGDGARFRSARTLSPEGTLRDGSEFIFCYKNRIGDKVLEIETLVSEEDYELALTGADRKLNKLRFKIPTAAGLWDIDYFLMPVDDGDPDSQMVYFVMAEFEHERGTPVEILGILKPHVHIEVPLEKTAFFSSRKLCDPQYARRVVHDYHAGKLTAWYY